MKLKVDVEYVPKHPRISLNAVKASGFSGWPATVVSFGCEEQQGIYS